MGMMTLGMFVFELSTLPYDRIGQRQGWRWAETERIGDRPAAQYVGPGEDSMELSGILVPIFAGRYSALDTIRDMADQGECWPLIDGTGKVLGNYRIDGLDTEGGLFFQDGLPRRTDFRLALGRVS